MSRSEQKMQIIKGGGTVKFDMRKWNLVELMEKHERDVEHYKDTVSGEIGKVIMNKCFLPKYVSQIENRESSKMIDLVISHVNYNTTSMFHHPERDVEPDGNLGETPKGTHYVIRRRDGKYNEVDVFVPDDENDHAVSNFYMFTSFRIRCRYIQRALMDHPTRSMTQMSTLHKRWDIRGHPLYKDRYDLMVGLMRIDGLDVESMPNILEGAADESSSDIIVKKPREFISKNKRYTEASTLTKKIVEYAKENMEIFHMVMPQLNVMLDNCIRVNSKSKSKSREGRMDVAIERNVSLPRFPDSVLPQDFCVVNHANWTSSKSKTSSSAKKRKTKCQTSKARNMTKTANSNFHAGIPQVTTTAAKNQVSHHQSCDDDQCYKCMKLSVAFGSAFGNMNHHPNSCPREEQYHKMSEMVSELVNTVDMEEDGKEGEL